MQLGFGGVGIAIQQQIVGMADGRHRVADFVRQIGGELPQRSELSGQRFGRHFAQRAHKQHQKLSLLLNQRHGAHMHGMLENMDIGFKSFIGLMPPAPHQIAKHVFLFVHGQAGKIGFGLAVEQPHPLSRINHDHRLLHAVEHQPVEPAHAPVGQLVLTCRFGGRLQIRGQKSRERGH